MNGPDANKIQNLFSDISKSYDSANDAITFGMARAWRKKLVQWSEAKAGDEILDIATGTGDLAFDFFNYTKKQAKVIGVDFCEPMLEIAKDKAVAKLSNIEFKWGDACDLQFADSSFDIVSISYGIRNVADLEKAIQEMHRILKPGGRLMILETGSKDSGILSPFVNAYASYIMPIVGGMISGKKSAYKYLSESSSQFPSGNNLIFKLKKSADFKTAEFKKILGGASFIYKLTK
jgi:demethylmenaquinone methyltransferase / 2-methoxy-6-polyprenyl-1,4-benzoquinol methylase